MSTVTDTLTTSRAPTTMPRAMVMLFACASGLSVANVYYAQPLLDALAAEFSISQAAVGGVITATQVGCGLALLLLVPLGDRMDRRRLMLLQLGALVLALIGVAIAATPVTLLAGMLAVGLLGTAMTQGLIAYAATAAAPEERGRIVGTTQGGVVIGLLLARVLAGFIADLGGWRMVYFTSATVMAALAYMLWRTLPEQRPTGRLLSYPQLLLSMVSLLSTERVLQIRGMLALLMFAVFNIFWSALVLPLSEPPYSFSHTIIGAFGLVGVVGALAATRAGYWADRGLGQWTTGLALLLLLASWLPLWFTMVSLWALVLGIIIIDLAGQAIHVTNQSMIFSTRPEAHSRLVGCYMLFYAVGSGLGAIATTAIYAAAGWAGVCVLGSFISLLALIFWLVTMRFMPKPPPAR
ncbi:MFS transporter [Ectopseudomonas oleovorans]|uniref:MFS transporter n=1 Tax=Ectopseudomonas oleovorans TaxID=301 RepID=UPI00244C7243|nr:MFS transporter [Pseudomonas oleovorans]MDH2197930.1 MFS transporter [Pseudomonas oleovorans]